MGNYRPKFHFTAKEGWINDPNGFCFFKGKYHLFFQYHEKNHPGCMSWGHAVSDDLIHFEELEPVIKHDSYYDKNGSWSGSSFVKDDVLYLMYTGHCETENGNIQTQNIVISEDGYTFRKYEGNPVISLKDLPSNCKICDFRDPSIFEHDGMYYVLIGNKSKEDVAQMLLYKSKDLLQWEFDRILISSNELGYMLECPSSAKIGDKRVLITSPQGLKDRGEDFWNIYSSIYTVGSLDFKELNYLDVKEIDHGLDFYAPHIISNGNILISWMSIWERSLPLQELGNKWMNAFTMPRVLSLKNDKLIQKPLSHFSEHFVEDANYEMNINEEVNLLKGQFKHLHLEFDRDNELSIKLFKKDDKYCEVKYLDNKVYIDRRNSLTPIVSRFKEKSMDNYRYVSVNSNKVVLDIYLDRFLVEVYINEGEEVMSFTCVHPSDFDDISFKGNNKLVKIISKNFK